MKLHCLKRSLGLCVLLILFQGNMLAQTPAFLTAEGFGKWATGGRGGRVVEVTNLEDDTEGSIQGSLRWALQQYSSEPITVVFRVSGVIELVAPLRCSRTAGTTIAGQTAPGDGICIRGAKCNFGGCKNVIIRHIRFRIGLKENEDGTTSFIEGGSIGIENASNWIIDHCTFGWSGEENMTIYDNTLTTVQWCLVHEGLYNSGHGKGNRGYGAQWGGQSATYHHNLLAHCYSRSPRFNGARSNDIHVLIDYVNNVNYNWGKVNACYGGDMDAAGLTHRVNMVGNYYKTGPARSGNSNESYFVQSSYHTEQTAEKIAVWYMKDNYMDGSKNASNNTNNYNGLDASAYAEKGILKSALIASAHFDVPDPVKTETAANAFNSVLAGAGAFPRDKVDARIVEEVRNGTTTYTGSVSHVAPGIIDHPADVGGYPDYNTYNTITDNDHDGMDDAWESLHGLNPLNANDRNLILNSGYTALDAYLGSLVGEDIPVEFSKPYDMVVAKDGSGDYTTLNEAIEAASESAPRTTIFVKKGLYEEKVFIGNRWQSSNKVISLIGEDVDSVVIFWDDYLGKEISYPGKDETITADGATCPTMTVMAPDFYMENITVKNPSTTAQAVALYQGGDRQVLKNCKILGNQDTHRTKKGCRYFYYRCTIEGGVDFIYAGGTCYFYQCDIVSNRDGYITAPEDVPYVATTESKKTMYYGFFFNDCRLLATSQVKAGSVYMGRPWAEESGSVFMNCRLGNHINTKGWMEWDGRENKCYFGEYKNMNADGTALADVSQRVAWSNQVSDNDRYYLMGMKTIYEAVSSSTFDPLTSVVALSPASSLSVKNKLLSWPIVENALGYVVYVNGEMVDFASTNAYYDVADRTENVVYKIKAIGNNGGLSEFNGIEYSLTVADLDSILSPAYRVKLITEVSPKEAGSVNILPKAPSYEKGTIVTLSANRRYGYRFKHWAMSDSIVSTDSIFAYTVSGEATLTAVFEKLPLYTLTCNIVGGKEGFVQSVPKDTLLEEKRCYESGTEVLLYPQSHPIYEFVSWEDGTTANPRKITMDSDKTVQAIYRSLPFILGWTFANGGVDYYTADVYNSSDNMGEFNLMDKADNYLSWKNASQGYLGRSAAMKNQPMEKETFFLAEFSTIGSEDLLVKTSMAIEGNGYSVQHLEYSVDGANYIIAGNIQIDTIHKWVESAIYLPSESNQQNLLRLRWIPDNNSKVLGSVTGVDGTAITDVYVLNQQKNALSELLSQGMKCWQSGEMLHIQSSSSLKSLRIYDLTGTCVSQYQGTADTYDLSSLPQGLYLLHVQTTEGTRRVMKFVKK